MNQYLDLEHFSLSPDLSSSALETTLRLLLASGALSDRDIESRSSRLEERFRIFAATCPVPEWAPGLHLTDEYHRQYETYLPVSEIRAAISALCRIACRYEPYTGSSAISRALSWPDALAMLLPFPADLNPERFLRKLAEDEKLRFDFLAALFIPKNFGGSFNRYPLQAAFFRSWLAKEKARLGHGIAVLVTACGSGEEVYSVAAKVLELGFSPSSSLVSGRTLEPLELAAAAHGWFPQHGARSAAFRSVVQSLLDSGAGDMISFSQENLCTPREDHTLYDVIFCNGLLGGPLMHDREKLAGVVAVMTQRLGSGGIILAADRFHGGWKRKTPPAVLAEVLTASGLQVIDAGEGVGAVKSG